MKRALVLAAALLAAALFAGSALARVGYVHDLTGTATVRTGNQPPRPLRVGDLVDQGQTVATGEGSSAVIKFEDGQVMVLSERSAFTVQRYVYNKQRVRDSGASFELLRGGLRFITGVIGSTNRNVRITAATATIGVRGTDASLFLDAVTQIVTAAVSVGAIAMGTPLGSTDLGIGNFSAAGPNAAPSTPAPTAQAVAAVAQTLNTLAAARNIPVNTPVVVDTSARAAAAQAQAADARAKAAAAPQDTALQQQAQQATQQAADALAVAVTAAQQAYQQALQAGATPPAPPAPPPAPPAPAPEGTGTTGPTTTTTPTGTTGTGGGGTASPN